MVQPEAKLQRLIFLDIDGPVIPNSQFLIDRNASFGRNFAPTCIAAVKRLLGESGGKLVTNSTHNYHLRDSKHDLKSDLIAAGIKEVHFHENWRTQYPQVPRDVAVKLWLKENGDHNWVAFDDARFTDNKRLILIDADYGISVREFNQAARILKVRQFLVL